MGFPQHIIEEDRRLSAKIEGASRLRVEWSGEGGGDVGRDQHELDKMRGLTFLWVLLLAGGLALMFALTQWGLLDDVPISESAAIAVGTNNGIGIVAFGGWNAIGIVAIGGANSIGIISIGGFNSIGVISFGGLNSVGFLAHGGVGAFGARSTRFLAWSPLKMRGSKPC